MSVIVKDPKELLFKKTTTERAFIKLVKSKYNDSKRKLDETFVKRKNKWVCSHQLTDLSQLVKLAAEIEISMAK